VQETLQKSQIPYGGLLSVANVLRLFVAIIKQGVHKKEKTGPLIGGLHAHNVA
jgi:hypothetical protein